MLVITDPSGSSSKQVPSLGAPRKKKSKEDLLREASSHCAKGCSEWKSGMPGKALLEFKSALRIMEQTIGTFHPLTAKTYFWIGFILQKSSSSLSPEDDNKECLEAFQMAFRIRLQLLGVSDKSTKEALQSVRWAFQKVNSDSNSKDDFHLLINAMLRSGEIEQEGDDLLKTSNDLSGALKKYQQAVELCDGLVQSPPQLYVKLASCHDGQQEMALYWYRKALFGYWSSVIHRPQKHPGIKETWKNIKNVMIFPSSTESQDYIKMVEDSMYHQRASQQLSNCLTSQHHIVEAITLELQFVDASHPVVVDLEAQLDIQLIWDEVNLQIGVAEQGILAEAMNFARTDRANTNERLNQLERYQQRATACLEALQCITTDTLQSSKPYLEESQSEEEWLTRQVYALEICLAYLSHCRGGEVTATDRRASDEAHTRIDSLTQDLASLSVSLMNVREELADYANEKWEKRRQSLVSQMAELHQKIAFREASLEMIQIEIAKECPQKLDDCIQCLTPCLSDAREDLRCQRNRVPAIVSIEALHVERMESDERCADSSDSSRGSTPSQQTKEVLQKSSEIITNLERQIGKACLGLEDATEKQGNAKLATKDRLMECKKVRNLGRGKLSEEDYQADVKGGKGALDVVIKSDISKSSRKVDAGYWKAVFEKTTRVSTSRRAKYTIGMQKEGCEITDLEPSDIADPTSIQVVARIVFDDSLLSLSKDSQVHHKLVGGTWEDLGCIETRHEPFGWVLCHSSRGRTRGCVKYSLGTCLAVRH